MTTAAPSPLSITVASWNLAMLERSAQAPDGWSIHDTEAEVRRFILDRAPDVVTFQELPGMVPYVETHDMIRSNPRTHSGNLAVLAVHELMDPAPLVGGVPGCGLIVHFPRPRITVINAHLAPGPGAADDRLDQLERLLAATNGRRVLIIGDTNTRVDELEPIGRLGLATPSPPRATWDSRRNRFRSDGAAFTAYFTRLFHTPDLVVEAQRVETGPVSVDGHRFHLSDHYPLMATVAPAPTESDC